MHIYKDGSCLIVDGANALLKQYNLQSAKLVLHRENAEDIIHTLQRRKTSDAIRIQNCPPSGYYEYWLITEAGQEITNSRDTFYCGQRKSIEATLNPFERSSFYQFTLRCPDPLDYKDCSIDYGFTQIPLPETTRAGDAYIIRCLVKASSVKLQWRDGLNKQYNLPNVVRAN